MADNENDWLEITRGIIFPAQCDHYGHMNVRYYTHFFDDGTFLIWSCIGVDMREVHATGVHTVIAKSTIEYHHEMRAGDCPLIIGQFTRVGEKSVTVALKMLDAGTRELRASQETVIVFFDAETRRSAPIPAGVRECVERALSGTKEN